MRMRKKRREVEKQTKVEAQNTDVPNHSALNLPSPLMFRSIAPGSRDWCVRGNEVSGKEAVMGGERETTEEKKNLPQPGSEHSLFTMPRNHLPSGNGVMPRPELGTPRKTMHMPQPFPPSSWLRLSATVTWLPLVHPAGPMKLPAFSDREQAPW